MTAHAMIVRQAPKPEPHTVFGGWRMAYHDWFRTDDGWDCDVVTDNLPATVFPTAEACQAAIDARAY